MQLCNATSTSVRFWCTTAVACTITTHTSRATSFFSPRSSESKKIMGKSNRRSRPAHVNGGGGGFSVSGCAPTGGFRARAFRLWLWRALPVILIALMLMLILGSYLCNYPGISNSPKHGADLLRDKVNTIVCKIQGFVSSVTLPNYNPVHAVLMLFRVMIICWIQNRNTPYMRSQSIVGQHTHSFTHLRRIQGKPPCSPKATFNDLINKQ